MKDKITEIFGNIENRFKQALGINVAFVTFPRQIGLRDSANLEIEITLTADYESGANYTKDEDLIRSYIRNVGMQGCFKRSIIQNDIGENQVAYKINLSTAEREFGVLGYLGAKLDNLTLNNQAAKGFANKTGDLIAAIDRDFKQPAARPLLKVKLPAEKTVSVAPDNIIPMDSSQQPPFRVLTEEGREALVTGYSGRLNAAPIGDRTRAIANSRAAIKAALEAKNDGRE